MIEEIKTISEVQNAAIELEKEISNYVVGWSDVIRFLIIGIFTGGHILIEGVPGTAKTYLAKIFSDTMNLSFHRIQSTPDLMPSDITGSHIFNVKTLEFDFHRGPIFANLVLMDEINRAPPKTQAALFEVMEERQITFDGTKYEMGFPFLVVATQNPVEQEGTYNLPEAQLDRFLFKVIIDYPSVEQENDILKRYQTLTKSPDLSSIISVFSSDDIIKIQETLSKVKVEDQLLNYIAQITTSTRNHGKLYLGASPRASLNIVKAAKARAAMSGRDFITPDDIQSIAFHVLNHRVILTPEAEMEGLSAKDIITINVHPNVVAVFGEVNNPGLFKFLPRLSTRDYIKLAGGYTSNANKSDVWIRYANGSAKEIRRFSLFSPRVKDGSVITVALDESEKIDKTELAKEISLIVANFAQIAILIVLANK